MTRKVKNLVSDLMKDFETSPPIDVYSLAQKLGVRVEEVTLEETVSGMLVIEGEDAIIAINENHHPNRKRFSLAHELGHYKLHRHLARVFVDDQGTYTFHRDRLSEEGIDSKEVEANSFAAELLMPEKMVLEAINHRRLDPSDEETVRRLAHQFKVSTQAMSIRLATLGRFA